MHNIPLISIVTPSFNSAKYIEDCIQSVLNQNYPNFEHIIIDGGSTDGTIEILKKYSHLRWISEPDEGQSDAINKGFNLAGGELIGWLNADDEYISNTFNRIIHYYRENIDIIYGDYIINYKNKKLKYMNAVSPNKFLLLYRFYLANISTFVRRRVIEDGNYLDVNFEFAMDKHWLLRIMFNEKYKKLFIPIPLAIFNWHYSNKSLLFRKQQIIESRKIIRSYQKKFTFLLNTDLVIFVLSLFAKIYYKFIIVKERNKID